ncbi:MAG TPA: hypothetical protein V6D29_24500 [Leptolyngbyaceae cyanobacterium]
MATATKNTTGTDNQQYDIVSILYHALEGAASCDQYISDARKAKDDEVVSFLEQTKEEYRRLAEQAKSLLKARL